MRTISTIFALAAAMALVPGVSHASPLEPYLWKNRLIIIFAPSLDDRRLIAQRELNVHAIGGLQERDMVIFAVVGADCLNAELNGAPADGAARIRERFGIPEDGFAVVLIGKDGSEKYRSGDIVEPAFIFDIVDGMPMRRREMRERKT
jgi:hypothetical protein